MNALQKPFFKWDVAIMMLAPAGVSCHVFVMFWMPQTIKESVKAIFSSMILLRPHMNIESVCHDNATELIKPLSALPHNKVNFLSEFTVPNDSQEHITRLKAALAPKRIVDTHGGAESCARATVNSCRELSPPPRGSQIVAQARITQHRSVSHLAIPTAPPTEN